MKVILYDYYLGYPGGYYYTKYLLVQTASTMSLSNGLLVTPGPKAYIGGNEASTVMTALSIPTSSTL